MNKDDPLKIRRPYGLFSDEKNDVDADSVHEIIQHQHANNIPLHKNLLDYLLVGSKKFTAGKEKPWPKKRGRKHLSTQFYEFFLNLRRLGFTTKEISEALNKSEEAVKQYKEQARKAFSQQTSAIINAYSCHLLEQYENNNATKQDLLEHLKSLYESE